MTNRNKARSARPLLLMLLLTIAVHITVIIMLIKNL